MKIAIIGSGIAGLHAAWRLSDHGDVVVLTKRTLKDSSTAWAQGGIAAALGAGDSPALHKVDTLAAGAALLERLDVLLVSRIQRHRDLAREKIIAGVAGADFDLIAFAAEAFDGFDEEDFC